MLCEDLIPSPPPTNTTHTHTHTPHHLVRASTCRVVVHARRLSLGCTVSYYPVLPVTSCLKKVTPVVLVVFSRRRRRKVSFERHSFFRFLFLSSAPFFLPLLILSIFFHIGLPPPDSLREAANDEGVSDLDKDHLQQAASSGTALVREQ